jgi:hypothetical protein
MDAPGNDLNGLMLNGLAPASGKKSRSKACEECRKSKVSEVMHPIDNCYTDYSSAAAFTMNMVALIPLKLLNHPSHGGQRTPSGQPG